jgi:hypothetical protein
MHGDRPDGLRHALGTPLVDPGRQRRGTDDEREYEPVVSHVNTLVSL